MTIEEFIRKENKKILSPRDLQNLLHEDLFDFIYELELDNLIMSIALSDEIYLMRKLISSGKLNVNERVSYGNTPIFYACAGRSYDLVKFLIEFGADVNIKNIGGSTAIDVSRNYFHDDIINLLIKNGAHE